MTDYIIIIAFGLRFMNCETYMSFIVCVYTNKIYV